MCGRIFCKKCSRGVIELPVLKLRCCMSCMHYLEVTPEQEILQLVHARHAPKALFSPPVIILKATRARVLGWCWF